ncbi:ABC transporter ATP-binding protein [Oscillatoria sp. CS-180]|uniref:ABC transporter ATP-binding protein n=1 Tax=Oscillatoria sp. CS-180 TaxID=3021720 RepID=UPI00232E50DB|nr:ABC transporter ATP-binding protein [Oscillatoria sp. CS-180]MDB9526101.1 ABC transporter ATP-binding protein [Oscillatoria sp. CS-180]
MTLAAPQKRSSYRQLIPFVRPHLSRFILGFACILGYVLSTLVLPYMAGQVALYIGQGNVRLIGYWLGLGAVVFLVRSVFQYWENIIMIRASLDVALDLRKAVYAHLHRLGLDYYEQAKTGDLSYRLTEDIDRISEVMHKMTQQFVSCVLQLIAIPLYMLYLNWQLTLAGFVLAPLMAWLIGEFGNRLLKLSRQSQSQISSLSALLTEVFGNMRLVQAFAAQAFEKQRFNQQAVHNRNARYRAEQLKAIQYPAVGFLEAISIMLLFFLGGWQISQGNLTPQAFVSFLAAIALLLHPIDLVTQHYNEFKQTEASVERIFELTGVIPTLVDQPNACPLPAVTGRVEYSNVSFAYEPSKPVLQHLDLRVHPGEVIALVGSSGAGKTTLVNLLMRFFDPTDGQVLIDGINIREVTLDSLRRQIGLVPQDITLFSGNIAQNIAYGEINPSLERIEEAAKIANAHGFISQFSQGYHTWVGERGVNLSGGQRQRVAIARALYFDPRILILDEATSALDSESEALVQDALDRAMKNRTVFVIAHRLSTVREADRILFLEKGTIVESGTHDELLSYGQRYAQFYTQQFKT